jgi:hypothetical protein
VDASDATSLVLRESSVGTTSLDFDSDVALGRCLPILHPAPKAVLVNTDRSTAAWQQIRHLAPATRRADAFQHRGRANRMVGIRGG